MMIIYKVLAVFLGSGLGGVCRWLLGLWFNGSYPLGTLLANVVGCALIGYFSRLIPADSMYKLLLITGFCGGFTTFSTFINENFLLLRGSQFALSLAYMALSLVLGMLAAWLGWNVKCPC